MHDTRSHKTWNIDQVLPIGSARRRGPWMFVPKHLAATYLIVSALFALGCGSPSPEAGDAGPSVDAAFTPADAGVLSDGGTDAGIEQEFENPYDQIPDIPLVPVGAPALDPSHFVPFFEANSFLFESGLQSGVAAGVIHPLHMAVIRGQVFTRSFAPVEGATVMVVGHPEYGETQTRADGRFDMAVNGGEALSVQVTSSGFLRSTRTTNTFWARYSVVDPVVLVARDSAATTVSLGAAMQVARATPVSDSQGERQSTLIFPANLGAQLQLPDGTMQSVAELNVRATEYTVGSPGFFAIPAPLPPASLYTHLVEFGADEADAAGAVSVVFDAPVATYLENYIDLPVGVGVPSAFYDRRSAKWVPAPDGRVIAIVDIADGTALVDLDGDGTSESPEELVAAGFTSDELQALSTLYGAGQELWRVEVTHFTPYDYNRMEPGQSNPAGPNSSDVGKDDDGDGTKKDCQEAGSVIDVYNQVLGEDIVLVGTQQKLHYSSERVSGRTAERVVEIKVPHPDAAASLVYVILDITIAGRGFQVRVDSADFDDGYHAFLWDGLDAYGRELSGTTFGSIQYIYYTRELEFVVPEAGETNTLGTPAGSAGTWVSVPGLPWFIPGPTRNFTLFQSHEESSSFSGWGLSDYHHYDPAGRKLYLGSGGIQSSEGIVGFKAIAGGESGECFSPFNNCANPADYAFEYVEQMLSLPDGRVLFSTGDRHCEVFVVDGQNISVFAGRPCSTGSEFGDGLSATATDLVRPTVLARGPDESIYIADEGRHTIRKVDKQGIITTVIGTGTAGDSVDGVLAQGAPVRSPRGLAVAPSGDLYFTESDLHRVRFIGQDGLLRTLGGNGASGFDGDDGPVRDGRFNAPTLLAFDLEGSLFIADRGNLRIRKVTRAGFLTTYAGGGGSDERANLNLNNITGLAVSDDGELAVASFGELHQLVVGERSASTTLMAGGGELFSLARRPTGVAYGPAGNLLVGVEEEFTDFGPAKAAGVLSLAPALPGVSLSSYQIASADGAALFEFDTNGRHQQTLDVWTGALIWDFDHNAEGQLMAMRDAFGNEVNVERDAAGVATAIVSPDGDSNGLSFVGDELQSITYPSGESWNMTYQPGVLLVSLADPTGATSTLTYDARGRLTSDTDADTVAQTLERVNSIVTHTLPSGARTAHSKTARGTQATLTVTLPDGSSNEAVTDAAAHTTTMNLANGTVVRRQLVDSKRLGAAVQYLSSLEMDIPSSAGAIAYRASSSQFLTGTGANGLLDYTESRVDDRINGRLYRKTYNFQNRTETMRSPSGRRFISTLSDRNKLIASELVGIAPTTYTYDARGRLATAAVGGRTWSATYDSNSNLIAWTDPDGESTEFVWNANKKVVGKTLRDGRQVGWTYDARNRITSVTPPGRQPYVMNYSDAGRMALTSEPVVPVADGTVNYTYDADGALVQVALPGGALVDYVRDYQNGGRIDQVSYDGEIANNTYNAAGQVESTTTTTGVNATYGYAGHLVERVDYAGPFAATVTVEYNNDLQPSLIVAGMSTALAYDQDGYLSQAGSLSISRDPNTAQVSATNVGQIATNHTYTGFGEPASFSARVSGADLWDVARSFNERSQITESIDTVLGGSTTIGYQYDLAGRLSAVSADAQAQYSYSYDSNGNLVTTTGPGGTVNATYDGRDRLVSADGTTFTSDRAGALASSTENGTEITTYIHGLNGSLNTVVMPDNTEIGYLNDDRQRRVGRLVNGSLTAAWVRDPFGRIVEEVDAAGTLQSAFVYGDGNVVPDVMVKDGVAYRLLKDHRGSIRFVVDSSNGTVLQEMQYTPYGEVVLDSNPGFQPFGFAGGLYDVLTGFVRIGVREYDPRFGRFTSADPIGFASGSTNLYRYADADPVNNGDDGGYIVFNLVGAGIGALVGGVVNGINAMQSGGSFAQGALIGAAAGAIGGFAMNPLLAGAIIAGLTETGNIAFGITAVCGPLDAAGKILKSTAIGVAAGALGAGAKAGLGKALGPRGGPGTAQAAKNFTDFYSREFTAVDQVISGAAGAAAGAQ